jgi:hypothetical protein
VKKVETDSSSIEELMLDGKKKRRLVLFLILLFGGNLRVFVLTFVNYVAFCRQENYLPFVLTCFLAILIVFERIQLILGRAASCHFV